jgi:hypothetical protein
MRLAQTRSQPYLYVLQLSMQLDLGTPSRTIAELLRQVLVKNYQRGELLVPIRRIEVPFLVLISELVGLGYTSLFYSS